MDYLPYVLPRHLGERESNFGITLGDIVPYLTGERE